MIHGCGGVKIVVSLVVVFGGCWFCCCEFGCCFGLRLLSEVTEVWLSLLLFFFIPPCLLCMLLIYIAIYNEFWREFEMVLNTSCLLILLLFVDACLYG